jgi:hypothetical protein
MYVKYAMLYRTGSTEYTGIQQACTLLGIVPLGTLPGRSWDQPASQVKRDDGAMCLNERSSWYLFNWNAESLVLYSNLD